MNDQARRTMEYFRTGGISSGPWADLMRQVAAGNAAMMAEAQKTLRRRKKLDSGEPGPVGPIIETERGEDGAYHVAGGA